MPPRRRQSGNGEVIDGEVTDITNALVPVNAGSTAIAPKVSLNNPGTVRSNIQDGGYFDATKGKKKPIFVVTPATDRDSVYVVIRAYLSCLRHYPLPTVMGTFISVWSAFFISAFTLNILRGDTVYVTNGSWWDPTVLGTNTAAGLVGPVNSAAGGLHDLQMGETTLGQDLEPKRKQTVTRIN
jgi:hypothetical protein